LKCPVCGATLQSGAIFCPHCMSSLKEKKDITPARVGRGLNVVLTALIVCVALTVGAVGVLLLRGDGVQSGDTAADHSEGPEENATEGESIDMMRDVILNATYLTGKYGYSGLWKPNEYVLTHVETDDYGNKWDVYNIPSSIEGANVTVYVREDEKEMITTVMGLTDDTEEYGEEIALLIALSVYSDVLDDNEKRERITASEGETERLGEDTGHLTARGLPDRVGERCDDGTEALTDRRTVQVDESRTMLDDRRDRLHNGRNEHDIMVLYTCR